MAPEVMSAFVDAGLFRMWIPEGLRRAGGRPQPRTRVIEELARIDGSVGWVVSNCVTVAIFHQFLPAMSVKELLGDPGTVPCGAFWPPGTATADRRRLRVSGNWSFASASRAATSLMVLSVLTDDHGPVLRRHGAPITSSPSSTAATSPSSTPGTPSACGPRGARTSRVTDLHVPQERSYPLGPWETTEGPFAAPLYRLGLIIDAVRIAQVGVGIAQGALDEFIELATSKTPAYTGAPHRRSGDRPGSAGPRQRAVQAARDTLRASVQAGWADVQDGPRITGRTCLPMGLAAAFAMDASVQAVDLVYESAGSTAFRDECPLQRRFRDLQTLRQNTITSWSRYESLGKLILGRPDDWPFHEL